MAYLEPHFEITELEFPGPSGRVYPNDQRQIRITFVLLTIASVAIVAMILAAIL